MSPDDAPQPPSIADDLEPTPEPSRRARSHRWGLLGLFLLGALSTTLVVLPRRFPVTTYATWCRLRYGSLPSARGLILSLNPCPAELRGRGPGPWVLLEFRDISAEPNLLVLPESAGEELSFEVHADGRLLTPTADPAREVTAQALRPHLLRPRSRIAVPVDLSRYVEVPSAWTRLEVVVARAQLGGDGHTLSAEGALSR
jgi:hypothetical protein